MFEKIKQMVTTLTGEKGEVEITMHPDGLVELSAEPESTQPLPGADLPAWKCHKIVHAAKIVSIEYVAPRDDSAFAKHALYLDFGIEWGVTPVIVDPEWFAKHYPDEGGYLVVYEDGYQSYCPAETFESCYTLLEKAILAEANAKCGCDNPPNSTTAPLAEAEPSLCKDYTAVVKYVAPLAEAESILAWLMTQPSTLENKIMRAQAGAVVDYLKAN